MKTAYKTLSCIATAALLLTACDDVKEGDRYIEMDAIVPQRAVLLEDFTGQNCINCPEAHVVMEQLVEQYGEDKVIPVSIHCGDFGVSVDNTNFDKNNIGLMTAEGQAIMEAYGIQQFPMGVVDMGSPLTFTQWAAAVRADLEKATDVNITATVDYTEPAPGSDQGEIGIKAQVISGSSRTANIQFWIVEDGIVARQRSTAGMIRDYVHNHVFRAQVFDGLKGQEITLKDGVYTDVEGSITARYTDKERWEVANLSVVVFVSDGSGVLQVIKVPVIAKDNGGDDQPEQPAA
jgi:putative lipoprotein